ncbi:MAG TPA: DNA polymerase III subunit delta' [Candidatus Blautia gallistercoris]|uniref:DNA polymerase III subunit delta' n=1 Tax=Candidatus Blautia gallistercoris TaxID=2838490 RepID=A0A9D1WIL2_9FIRM|nr:DNA polymerase III subunit delta' [Candidatus Blautia gallistercoris]
MEGFKAIVGHEEVIEHLQSAISTGKVSHAYVFSGESGSGKKLLATTFAMTLQCEEKGTDPCLKCESCKRTLSKNHPDIIGVVHEKPNTISIEEIRRQIVEDVQIKPYYGPYKIYIVNDADKMTVQAQNALLKTIEEPPVYAVILLLTNNIDGLLPTILSRCVRLDLRVVPDNLVKNYLMERLHIPDYQAEVDASFAQGNIGKAKEAATSEEFAEMTRKVLQLLRYVNDMEVYELVDIMKELAPDKENVYDYLDLFLLWFRDVLMFKATRDVDNLVFKQEINLIKDQARERSYEGLEKILDAVEKAKTRLRANVNFDLVMELLFLTIREK